MASGSEAVDERLVRDALGGDAAALRALVKTLAPVIQGQVERGLRRRKAARQRDVRQEVSDMTQDVFMALFADGARALKGWDPARGLSLRGFVRLVADREVASILRSGRRTPWRDDPTETDELDRAFEGPEGELDDRLGSRQMLAALLDRLREALSPYGLHLFQLLIVEEQPVADVCASQGMTPDAVYAWRSRLTKLARKLGQELLAEHDAAGLEPLRAGGPP